MFNHQSDVFSDVIREDLESGDAAAVDLFPYMKRLTLDIILETAMGRRLQIQVEGAFKSSYSLLAPFQSILVA